MKVFAVAFGIACGMAAILFCTIFAILTFFQRPEAVTAATSVGALTIGSFKSIAEFLERENGRKNLAAGKQNPVYDFRGFQIAWPLMTLYGTLILLLVTQAGEFIAGFLSSVLEIKGSNLFWLILITNILTWIFGSYLVGRWIATRCARRGVLTILLVAALIAGILTASVVIASVIASSFELVQVEVRQRLEFGSILYSFAIRICIVFGAGLLGYWRGRRQRLPKYLYYLLRVLPAETREAVVELAFGEAQKLALR
jgi:hypothetical protein